MKRVLLNIAIFLSVFGLLYGLSDFSGNWLAEFLAGCLASGLSELAYRKWIVQS